MKPVSNEEERAFVKSEIPDSHYWSVSMSFWSLSLSRVLSNGAVEEAVCKEAEFGARRKTFVNVYVDEEETQDSTLGD